MHKKTIFSFLIILLLIPVLVNAGTFTVKGKIGYNLTINLLNPLNNESITMLTGDIGSSGQANLDFSVSNTKVNVITIARVNGKIAKKNEAYNINAQSASPIIIDLRDPPAPNPTPAPVPIVQNTTPPALSQPELTSAQEPVPETKENKTSFLTGMATSFESINISPAAKMIVIYTIIGIIVLAIIIFIIMFLIKKKRKSNPHKDFKITKFSSLTKESEHIEDIEEAEKRLKVAREEINRINEILNKRRAIKEAEKKLEEERRALERLKKDIR